MRYIILCLSFLFLVSCSQKKVSNHKLSPEHQKALESIEIMDDFDIELVAAEPLVADPVAMEIDENGDIYVVEMHGYPLDLSNSGKIKLLKDTDGDGYPDKSIVFADSLRLPNGIQKWKNGFIVTDAPDVLFLADTNGDGKADIRKKMLTGFALSNPQHNLNTPRFEFDNWIYLGHEGAVTPFVYKKEFGDEGNLIKFGDKPDVPGLGLNADGRMVRFKPNTYEIEELSGETQFGHTQNAWGNRLYTSNANHLFHEVIAKKNLVQNPNLLVTEATQNIPDHGEACEVFPITQNPNHQLLTDVGVITSSCGVTWYLGGAFGEKYKNVTFIAEPVHNLVHADIIQEKGSSFTAKRLIEKKEFLASKDSWFRPVNFYIGPDGAMYLIDYYRQLIEHPEWMSDEVNKSGALYNGKDKGRIYRITPKSGLPMDWMGKLGLQKKSDNELVSLLDNSNIWYRRTAQRLLMQKNALAISPELKKMVGNAKNPEAKVHALWLLNEFKNLDKKTIDIALNDTEPGVRANAVKLSPNISEKVLALQNDPDAKVRYALLNRLGTVNTKEATAAKGKILNQDHEDKWVGIAAIAASKGSEVELLKAALGNKDSQFTPEFYAYLGATIAKSGDKSAFQSMLGSFGNAKTKEKAELLSGVQKLWAYSGLTLVPEQKWKEEWLGNLSSNDKELRKVSLDLLSKVGLPSGQNSAIAVKKAEEIVSDTQKDQNLRADMLRLVILANPQKHMALLKPHFAHSEADAVKETAINAIPKNAIETYAPIMISAWKGFNQNQKTMVVNTFLENTPSIHLLLNAVNENKVSRNDLEWSRMVEMMNYYDQNVRKHAREVLAINEDRKAVLQDYMTALNLKATPTEGKKIFEQNCKICHKINNEGTDFGPDLSTLKSRNAVSILTEIINPNNSIADKYDNWKIGLKNGTELTGIIAAENSSNLTLKQMGGSTIIIQKSELVKKDKTKTSAMPAGLENAISKQQMANLIGFIKGKSVLE
jgi:putative membrane-bound dehydrogenase-like protein